MGAGILLCFEIVLLLNCAEDSPDWGSVKDMKSMFLSMRWSLSGPEDALKASGEYWYEFSWYISCTKDIFGEMGC